MPIIPAQTFSGGFIGVGMEAMFIPNWAVRLEYRYSQFSHDINRYVTTTGAFSTLVSEKLSTQTIRADLVYRFNWGKAPVIAKY